LLDRITPPDFKLIGRTNLFRPESYTLSNSIPLFVFNLNQAELIKLEWVFKIQDWDPTYPLDTISAAKLMDDGTRTRTSASIIEEIDFYGSYFQIHVQADTISLELFSLRKYLSQTLPIIRDVLTEANFPESEIEVFALNNVQRLQVESQKVQKLGSKLYYASLFGNSHRYGYAETIKDYKALERNRILETYQETFYSGNCTLIASGKISQEDIKTLEDVFGKEAWGIKPNKRPSLSKPGMEYPKPGYRFQEMQAASQSAIKIGKTLVLKSHPDFPYLQILNTVLGGYFGSRLMSNIREDKGYTYGIGSSVQSLQEAGFFTISTEVKAESTQDTLKEIQKEVMLLQTELISDQELGLVKNFIRGSFLGSLENAFSYADKFKGVYFHGLDYGYYDRLFEAIDGASPKMLRELAGKYWDWNSFHTIIVGKE